ncbi:hypothetical protein QYE76_047088 [Lolium multiflorum]|uniref:VQ domain-containing protein n=1 Tax=Lolium multiflorum TaxID=4521 RepID=A0AAD8TN71_LOLMU|nr:hypothetical protein QYE76_047088 [Lolium multiflorum]
MAPHSSAVKLPSRTAAPPGTGAHRWSHAIAKGPPRKIRIVHVVEPTVIKTDARQFRELVQRLTGKPSGGGRGGGGASSSSSSAEIAASESSSSGGSESDRVVVAPTAVKAEVKAEEEDAPSPDEEGFARAWRDTNGGATTAAGFKAVVKEEADAASPEAEEFARAFGEVDDTFDAFFHGLDDFLLGAFQGDGFSL